MWGSILLLGRRPIYLGVYPPNTDLQGAIPRGWCMGCGTEVFSPAAYCPQCEKRRREENERLYHREHQSLPALHTGAGSPKL